MLVLLNSLDFFFLTTYYKKVLILALLTLGLSKVSQNNHTPTKINKDNVELFSREL